MMIDEVEKKISRIVHCQSSYLVDISNTDILSESFFKYPIIEYLERNQCSMINLEEKHPIFKYKRIDVFWEKDDVKNYMELKYVRQDTGMELQRYFNDLFRLYCILKSFKGEKINCYFLASGKSDNWNLSFKNYNINSCHEENGYTQKEYENSAQEENKESGNGIYSNWLSFDIEKPIKSITNNNTEFYRKFQEEYTFSQASMSFEADFNFNTKLLWINEGKDSFCGPCSTALWKIEI